jgi:hypothetical protein
MIFFFDTLGRRYSIIVTTKPFVSNSFDCLHKQFIIDANSQLFLIELHCLLIIKKLKKPSVFIMMSLVIQFLLLYFFD